MTKWTGEDMDKEWMALILEAKELGLSKELVREFLYQNKFKDAMVENR